MITKTKYPGICNNCGRKCEYQIRCGIRTLLLCGTCASNLGCELKIAVQKTRAEELEYDNSMETGLIKPRSKE